MDTTQVRNANYWNKENITAHIYKGTFELKQQIMISMYNIMYLKPVWVTKNLLQWSWGHITDRYWQQMSNDYLIFS